MKKIMLMIFMGASMQAFAGENSPHALLAYLKVQAGAEAQFLEAAQAVIKESRKEPGLIIYNLQESVDDPEQFVFYELFKSEADLEYHRTSKHVVDFLEQVKPILVPNGFVLNKFNNVNTSLK